MYLIFNKYFLQLYLPLNIVLHENFYYFVFFVFVFVDGVDSGFLKLKVAFFCLNMNLVSWALFQKLLLPLVD